MAFRRRQEHSFAYCSDQSWILPISDKIVDAANEQGARTKPYPEWDKPFVFSNFRSLVYIRRGRIRRNSRNLSTVTTNVRYSHDNSNIGHASFIVDQ